MRSKKDSKRSCGRLVGAVALCFLLFTGGGVELDEAASSAAESLAMVPVEPPPVPVERRMILSIARRYQRSASHHRLEKLADTIYEESVRADVDPLLVASIIAKESSFRDFAVSPVGAVGLMQIRPTIAQDLAQRRDLEWLGPESLGSPTFNVRYGILYYKELVERFEGDATKALTAYNFGPTRVSRQLRERTYVGSAYAAQVLALYKQLSASRGQDA